MLGGMHTFQPAHTATKPQMNVIIAGASINGLMFALLCHQKRKYILLDLAIIFFILHISLI
jgi:hypothetical protein